MAKHRAKPGDPPDKPVHVKVVGWGPFSLPGEKRRLQQARREAEQTLGLVAENARRNRRS